MQRFGFRQGVSSSTTSGAGLGLCLIERQMRAQHGRVTVESSLAGTTSLYICR
jgi:sensor histidine kinase regulating citrate/malate metabolism